MQDLVILPTYDRPELLWLCLDHLARCPESTTVEFRVYVDAHLDQMLPPRVDINAVVAKFPQLDLKVGFRSPHGFHGNSFNLMLAYRDAYHRLDIEHVFMVEDDVMVHPSFFSWHREQHRQRLGCSIAVVNEPQYGHYASLGVCFRREVLKAILPHCRTAYFQNMRLYCRSVFPPSKTDCEQDGLFCRVLAGQKIVWASTPLAQHVGWYGYHRKRSPRPQGTLEQRYHQVKQVLSSTESLRGWVRDFGDIKPLQLSADYPTLSVQP